MESEVIQAEFVRANGLDFEVHTCGRGDRLALCLHGFPEHAFSWRYQLPYLAGLGYRVWAPNLRGYGNSSCPRRVKDYAIERLLEDAAGLIDASGCSAVILIGHDWGAFIAWYFAIRRVRSLERLVIMNVPHPAGMMRSLFTLPAQLLKSWYIFVFQIPWLPEAILKAGRARGVGRAILNMSVDRSRFPEDVLDVYRRNALKPGRLEGMINYYRAFARGGAWRQHRLGIPRIEIPTLMIWGEMDKALDIRTTYDTEKYVVDLTVRYLPGVSHWVQQEAPEKVNALLGAWLRDTKERT